MKQVVNKRTVEEKEIQVESAKDLSLTQDTDFVIEIPSGDIVTIEQRDISRIYLNQHTVSIWFMDGSHANFEVKLA